jgi:hypothetical protein
MSPPISTKSAANFNHCAGGRGASAKDAELLAELRVISNSSSSGSRFGLVKADNSSNSRAMLPNDNEVVDLVFRGLFLSRNKSEEQDQEINNAFLYFN